MTGTPAEYFGRMWTSDDPWDQERRFSERRKYDLTIASLPNQRYHRAFESGCATGILTEMLAGRCDALVAMDRHPRAVAVTTSRVASRDNVDVRLGALPDDIPRGPFDLIVFSELLYYLDADGVRESLRLAADVATPGAHLVAVHYRPQVEEHELLGDDVHRLIADHPRWSARIHHVEPEFLLDVCEVA